MPRVHGKNLTSLSVDDSGGTPRSLLAETVALNFQVSAKVHDVTTMGDNWEEAVAGLKGGDEFDHEVFYTNDATTGTRQVYSGRLGVEGTLTFGDGTRSVSCETIVTKLSEPMSVGDMIKLTATHKITGAVTFS